MFRAENTSASALAIHLRTKRSISSDARPVVAGSTAVISVKCSSTKGRYHTLRRISRNKDGGTVVQQSARPGNMGAMMVMQTDHETAHMLGIIGGAALLIAAPFSLQWSQKNVPLSLDGAEANATRIAGVSRRVHRGHTAAPSTERGVRDFPRNPFNYGADRYRPHISPTCRSSYYYNL